MDPENDTGILVTYLSQTIEESRRLREDLKQGRPGIYPGEGAGGSASPAEDALPQENVTLPDLPLQPG